MSPKRYAIDNPSQEDNRDAKNGLVGQVAVKINTNSCDVVPTLE